MTENGQEVLEKGEKLLPGARLAEGTSPVPRRRWELPWPDPGSAISTTICWRFGCSRSSSCHQTRPDPARAAGFGGWNPRDPSRGFSCLSGREENPQEDKMLIFTFMCWAMGMGVHGNVLEMGRIHSDPQKNPLRDNFGIN